MTELTWGSRGERFYETGIDRGVLYLNDTGVAWNGLVSVTENPSGGETTAYYQDGIRYISEPAAEEYEAVLQAFSSPSEFDLCDGMTSLKTGLFAAHQPRKTFELCYRTLIGNDGDAEDRGYKLHFIYQALASPSERDNTTISNDTSPIIFSWDITTTPILVPGNKPTAHLFVDSRITNSYILAELERILYGSEGVNPRLPSPAELIEMFGWELFRIIPEPIQGLAPLVTDGDPDLKSELEPGLYTATIITKLNETASPGLYTREN